MPTRIWANNHWQVADDGLASLGPVEYFIPRSRLCELRHRREAEGIASWPLQVAEKSWAEIEPFLEAYQRALELLKPEGMEAVDLHLSSEIAREIAFVAELRRR
jgi:hypothetical protein